LIDALAFDERRRELAGDGQRWFDLRRLAMAAIDIKVILINSDIAEAMGSTKKNRHPIPTNEANAVFLSVLRQVKRVHIKQLDVKELAFGFNTHLIW
jgi:hypothetical protein